VGSVGWVMQVEQGPDMDIVMFMDETLIKRERPKTSVYSICQDNIISHHLL
jgi:hypothetical protein